MPFRNGRGRVLGLVILLCFVTACAPASLAEQPASPPGRDNAVAVLFTNDVHCYYDRDIGYDVATPGNHEFDYGFDVLDGLREKLDCGYNICANFRTADGEPVYAPYSIIESGSMRVAFIGADTPDTFSKSAIHEITDDTGVPMYDFKADASGAPLYACLQGYIDEVRDEGADFVILVGHLGNGGDATEAFRSTEVIAHLTGLSAVIDGPIYVTGHKSPDPDTVGSAIACAALLRQLGYDACPVVLGELNNQTKFILESAGMEAPERLEDASGCNMILVDHSEYTQSAEGLRDARISPSSIITATGPSPPAISSFRASLSYEGMTDEQVFLSNYKEYESGGTKYGNGCVNAYDEADAKELAERMRRAIPSAAPEMDMAFAQISAFHDDVNVSYIVPSGDAAAEVLETAFGDRAVFDGTSYVLRPGVSRKQVLVPAITEVLEAHPRE